MAFYSVLVVRLHVKYGRRIDASVQRDNVGCCVTYALKHVHNCHTGTGNHSKIHWNRERESMPWSMDENPDDKNSWTSFVLNTQHAL